MDKKRRLILLGLVGITVSTLAPSASAQKRVRLRMRGLPNGARYNGTVLTRDQLRQCVAEQNWIEKSEAEVDRIQSSISSSENAITRLEAEIKIREPQVDRYSEESVNSFNVLIDRHRNLVDAHNAKLPNANIRIEQMNAAIQRFNAKCANHAYYDSDMRAVLSGN